MAGSLSIIDMKYMANKLKEMSSNAWKSTQDCLFEYPFFSRKYPEIHNQHQVRGNPTINSQIECESSAFYNRNRFINPILRSVLTRNHSCIHIFVAFEPVFMKHINQMHKTPPMNNVHEKLWDALLLIWYNNQSELLHKLIYFIKYIIEYWLISSFANRFLLCTKNSAFPNEFLKIRAFERSCKFI